MLGYNLYNAAYQNQGKQEGIAQTKVGTAAPGQVLAGKTFTNSTTVGATGTMPNNGAVTGSITTSGGSYTIPAGYHNGSGKVTGPTLAALVKNSNVTLNNASNLLSGVTAYGKDGVKYTGSMVNNGAWTNTPTTKGKVTIPAGYHNGSGYIDTTSVYNKGIEEGLNTIIQRGKLKYYELGQHYNQNTTNIIYTSDREYIGICSFTVQTHADTGQAKFLAEVYTRDGMLKQTLVDQSAKQTPLKYIITDVKLEAGDYIQVHGTSYNAQEFNYVSIRLNLSLIYFDNF